MTETHTGCYRDVTVCPVTAMASAARFVEREWGERYHIGYVGRDDSNLTGHVYVFQVRARDGSLFAVGAGGDRDPFELEGQHWLDFLREHEIEATVKV